MKYRRWWLGLLIMILLAVVCVVLMRPRTVDATGSSVQNLRGRNAAGTGPAATNLKRPHAATITSLVSQLPGKVKLPELTAEQVARFLADNQRNPEALLSVSRLKDDLSLLREAATALPEHALVQLELALRGQTPDEKQQALEAFRKLAPDNAVGDCLAALDHFGRNQPAEALEDLAAVEDHPGFGVRSPAQIQSAEDLYRSAGSGLLEAKAAALMGQPRTLTMALFRLTGNLATLQQQYTTAGDDEAARTMLQLGLALSGRLRVESRLLVDDVVGIGNEIRLLRQLPQDATVPGSGQTAAARIEALTAARQEITDLAKQSLPVLDAMTEGEVLAYLQHLGQDGELKALRWLQQNRQ